MKYLVPLPNHGTVAEFAGTQYVLAQEFARGLHKQINDKIQAASPGVDWFKLINDERSKAGLSPYLDAKDARFLLREATYHASILRHVIVGIGSEWDESALKLVRILNQWAHHQVEPTAAALLKLLAPMADIAALSELDLLDTLEALTERTRLIRDMVWVPGEGIPETPALPADAAEYVAEIEKKVDEVRKRPPLGGIWLGEPGQRRVKLHKALRDITEQGRSIRAELKPDPDQKIIEFLRYYPQGGDLRIDDDGAVMGYVKGVPRLVGWLGPEPDVSQSEVRGFVEDHEYVYTGDDIQDVATRQLLSHVAEEPIDDLLAELREKCEPGQSLTVSQYGDLVQSSSDDPGHPIAKVHPSIWF